MGCNVGIGFMFCGVVHQGLLPKGARTVASGHVSGPLVLFSQSFVPSGTILQPWSDRTSMTFPSVRSARRPKSIPAYEDALYAFTARVWTPGDSSGVTS